MRAAAVASFVVGSFLILGCGSKDDGTASPQDASSDASPIVTDDGATHETSPPPTDTGPKLCWVSHSTDSSSSDCNSCSQVACAAQWASTWGPGWSTDDYGGACAKDATCLCTCDETDTVCRQNCDITFEDDACRTAKQALYDCETVNCSKPCGRSF